MPREEEYIAARIYRVGSTWARAKTLIKSDKIDMLKLDSTGETAKTERPNDIRHAYVCCVSCTHLRRRVVVVVLLRDEEKKWQNNRLAKLTSNHQQKSSGTYRCHSKRRHIWYAESERENYVAGYLVVYCICMRFSSIIDLFSWFRCVRGSETESTASIRFHLVYFIFFFRSGIGIVGGVRVVVVAAAANIIFLWCALFIKIHIDVGVT